MLINFKPQKCICNIKKIPFLTYIIKIGQKVYLNNDFCLDMVTVFTFTPTFSSTRNGTPVLDIGDNRYYKNNRSKGPKATWFCSKRRLGCRASLIICDEDIISYKHSHNHRLITQVYRGPVQ